MDASSVFHRGELAVQARFDEVEIAARNGRAISDSIMRGAWRFVSEQVLVVLGTVDDAGAPRTSMLVGEPGFAEVVEPRRLTIELARLAAPPAPEVIAGLSRDPRVGLLFIEFATRRRLRVNGRARVEGGALVVDVDEAFPNCPKYIQSRTPSAVLRSSPNDAAVRTSSHLEAHQLERVRAADTFFIASSAPGGNVDVSHRGGPPGFVDVSPGRLAIPDYAGNHMYNTLGNLELDARASLLFVDFGGARGAHDAPRTELELEGTVSIEARAGTPFDSTGGTGRWWTFTIARVHERQSRGELTWSAPSPSPHLPLVLPTVAPPSMPGA
jgi:hypothetical protein